MGPSSACSFQQEHPWLPKQPQWEGPSREAGMASLKEVTGCGNHKHIVCNVDKERVCKWTSAQMVI